MLTQFKKSISEKIISLVRRNERQEKQKAWLDLVSNTHVNIHATFVPQDADIFKGDNKKYGYINIHEQVLFRDYCRVLVFPDAQLHIGKGVFFNNHCSINCLENIEIGNDTIFGEGVKIYDHNHLITKDSTLHVEKEKYTTKPVKIGKNCWIGSNAVILKGVSIGDNTIVGAGCVIHKSVPSNTIVKNNQNLMYESL